MAVRSWTSDCLLKSMPIGKRQSKSEMAVNENLGVLVE